MPGKSPETFVEMLPEDARKRAAEIVARIIREAVDDRGEAAVALVGGTTPHGMYQRLAGPAGAEVPWASVHVFFGDERDVPHDNVESNYFKVQRTLLDHVPVPPDHIHPMSADAENIDDDARQYEQTIRQIVPAGGNDRPRFDLILLGMGAEGHTASLFPCTSEALTESERLVIGHHVPVLGRDRMTFTFPLINAAANVLMLVTGEDKSAAVAALVDEPETAGERFPAGRVAPEDGRFMLVCDAAAAKDSSLRPGV